MLRNNTENYPSIISFTPSYLEHCSKHLIHLTYVASAYEMRIADDPKSLRHDFMNAERLVVSGSNMTPNVSGKVERLQIVVSSNDEFTATTYFAIVAIDEVGNRGDVSNIVPITIGLTSQFEGNAFTAAFLWL